ncbi:hypothetical protein J2X72_003007 [Phyllobacterium sp. 1468]|nr:hypothetical protein [Phyllobacterium sp. 1468]
MIHEVTYFLSRLPLAWHVPSTYFALSLKENP